MVTETFLSDNGFSGKASSKPYVYIKDMSKVLKAEGNLHAHIKVSFENDALSTFEIHGTVRTESDSEAIALGRADDRTVGRAIWVYDNGTIRSPASQKFWIENSGTTLTGLKAFCRKLCKEVDSWRDELVREGGTARDSVAEHSTLIDHIGQWTKD